ncbi:MAG TPA: hypothetical protein VMT54_13270 [Candidatus Cybelea sp.]|nr:hypothetical protein [Candidatus Cybelea sp.]
MGTLPKALSHGLQSTVLATAAVLAVGFAAPAMADSAALETFAPRPAASVLPAGMLTGPHHQVVGTVQTFGYLNNFVVQSEYGTFQAPSNTMLRRLIREIGAIDALHGITLTEAYGKALGQAALSPVRGAVNLVTNPVDTVKAVPGAIFSIFERTGSAISSTVNDEKTAYEDSSAAQLLQMSSYKRDYCKQFGVDPYSSNAVLQDELESVSWAAAVGNLTVSAATMASGSTVVQVLSYGRNISQAIDIVAAEPPAELALKNKAALKQMGIAPALADQFMGQKMYSPRAKTILLYALGAMQNTAGRDAMVQAALNAPDEVTAIMYQQMAELLNGYDAKVAPIVRLERYNRVVLAREKSGKAVALLPLDYAIWNQQAAGAVTQLAKALRLKPGSTGVAAFWLTGTASPLFKQQANALGFDVKENVGSQLPLAD